MTVSRLFNPAGLRVDSTYLGHVGDQSVDNGLEDLTAFAAGSAFPNFTGNKMHAPEYQVETSDLLAALGLMTESSLAADLTAVPVDLFFREHKAQGIHEDVAETSKHQIYRLEDNALLYWESLQARQDDDAATMNLRLVPIYNGSNAIIQMPAEAIPASAAQVAPWTLGAIWINGAQLQGCKSMQWQNNVQVEKQAADGEPYPTYVTIRQIRPVITIETLDLRTVAGYAAEGVAVSNLQIYLRRRKPSLLNYADGDAQHIKLTATGGSLKWRRAGGSPTTATVEIHLHGTTLFSVATAQTITSGVTTTTTTTTTTT
jgi:hypothetical protein